MSRTKLATDGSTPAYAGLAFIGGHPGLDFVNSVKYRGTANDGDRLVGFSDVVHWAHAAGRIDEVERCLLLREDESSSEIKKLLGEICAFREAVRIVLAPENHMPVTYDIAACDVERAVSQLRAVPNIDRETGVLMHVIPIEKPQDLKARIVACLRDLLSERSDLNIKTCKGHDCDWMFVDATKAKRRKWCDTRTCGNNARVRRHRETKV